MEKEISGGIFKQLKDNPSLPYKAGKLKKKEIYKVLNDLCNQKPPEKLTINQLDINQVLPLLPPHEE